MKALSGAAHIAFVRRLDDDPYADDWNERHERIAHWHLEPSCVPALFFEGTE